VKIKVLTSILILLFILISTPASALEEPYGGNVFVEYDDGILKSSFDIDVDREDERGRILLALPNSSVKGDCIKKKTEGQEFLTHYIPRDCKSAEFVADRDLESVFDNGTGFGAAKDDMFLTRHRNGRSPYSIWWHDISYSHIESDQTDSTGWNSEDIETLNVSYSSEISARGPYIYGGSEWRKESVAISDEDIAVVNYIKGTGDRMIDVLDKMTVPMDNNSEIVNIFILKNDGEYSKNTGVRGLYTSNGNSIILNGGSSYEALVHEYSHSQQEYKPSEEMRWIIEGGATYDATVEMEEQGIENRTKKWSSFTVKEDETEARTVLSNSDTWRRITPYSKGQSVLVLIDMCLSENTDYTGVSDVQQDIRESGGNLTYTRLVEKISQYSNAEEEVIENWLYPYIFGPYAPTDDKIIGEDRSCWKNADDPPSFTEPYDSR
jgi:hypothetical protein